MSKNSDHGCRGLSDEFFHDLKKGLLHRILEAVKADNTLDLQIRHNYINIYYRGGNLLKIAEKAGGYSAEFETKYFKKSDGSGLGKRLDGTRERIKSNGPPPQPEDKENPLPQTLRKQEDVEKWIGVFPDLKQAIDLHLGRSKKDEREFQQVLVRENNYGRFANSTDYFICDIEYATNEARFDLVGVHWPADSQKRQITDAGRLAFFEMKYGDDALRDQKERATSKKAAGLKSHVTDINGFLEDETRVEELKMEMVGLFKQKEALGLIDCAHPLTDFSEEKPELIIILANHKPRGTVLRDALGELPRCDKAELKIAVSTFAGYGLFEQNIYSLAKFREKFKHQICSGLQTCN